IRNKE
ncbi:hypothetical protein CLOM_g12810, partial [Closterium sp. NIES-68]